MSRKIKRPVREGVPIHADDRRTILRETAHIPDRDQVFHSVSVPPSAASREAWSGDLEEQIKGKRSPNIDMVDELAELVQGVDGAGTQNGGTRSPEETPVRFRLDQDRLAELDDDALRRLADSLGVAGRGEMNRAQLERAVHAAL